jgi:GNAT superfamily N-acetyltransferase
VTGFDLVPATAGDAPAIAALRNAVAERLTRDHGRGHWSSCVTERGVLQGLRSSRLLVAWEGPALAATLQLATKKPWAIDKSYFAPSRRPLYLTAMAVDPGRQRTGIGRRCLEEARRLAQAWPGDALRLDAYDHPAGAGAFYEKCGFHEVGRVVYRTVPLIYYELLLTPS